MRQRRTPLSRRERGIQTRRRQRRHTMKRTFHDHQRVFSRRFLSARTPVCLYIYGRGTSGTTGSLPNSTREPSSKQAMQAIARRHALMVTQDEPQDYVPAQRGIKPDRSYHRGPHPFRNAPPCGWGNVAFSSSISSLVTFLPELTSESTV